MNTEPVFYVKMKGKHRMSRVKSILELKDKHKGEDIYVLCAGASIRFMHASFFEGKIVLGVNSIWRYFPCTYTVHKHEFTAKEAIENAIFQKVIAPKYDYACTSKKEISIEKEYFQYTHKQNKEEEEEKSWDENIKALGKDEDLFSSRSTVTTAMHLACYMGGKNIILVGHDCGYIDKKSYVDTYGKHNKEYWGEKKYREYYNEWFKKVEEESLKLKIQLMKIYECNIVSLNAFIGIGLEGHKFERSLS